MTTEHAPVPGIPTRYRGRQYRSRLEARWACFFDLLGWHYEYEPCDFEGWIPDFVLCEAEPTYVEVKPVTTFPDDVAAKIDSTSCAGGALIVGVTLHALPAWGDAHPCIGWLREPVEHQRCWASAPFGVWTPPTPYVQARIGFCHEIQSFRDRITGVYEGGCWGAKPFDQAALLQRWAEAGNVTQWQARITRTPHGQR